jgi:hypothetical protein
MSEAIQQGEMTMEEERELIRAQLTGRPETDEIFKKTAGKATTWTTDTMTPNRDWLEKEEVEKLKGSGHKKGADGIWRKE